MACKTLTLLCLAAVFSAIQAGVVPVAAPAPVLAKLEEYDPNPQYSFAYDVQDALTGDSKAQYETRNGDVVQGSYSLIEADGTRRIVDYTADSVNGFNAVVNREPAVAVAPAVVPRTIAPVVSAPLVARTVAAAPAPVYSAPLVARSLAPAAPVYRSVAAPVVRTVAAAPAPVYSAPLVARTVAAAPVYQTYTLPRAVATRLAAPQVAVAAYAV